ncbi:bifunctional riboflavin kinase/FAD synthetase [Croceivirga thetidis]|uniref:Riboflavin biosynthesis protein n=1 Tax=Croceivirga thetidis TaxID=2721623 RepID=A0ABX1GLM4_9FLAO|nr:bifunctional riboflavin kinase/FAD synthetase [Croceivirga thetidis]
MKTIRGISQYNEKHPSVITIGTFDGVHIGHRKILERLNNRAKATGLKSILLTFFPHPRMVLQKDSDIKMLNTLDEKVAILENMGLDYTIIHPFTKSFSRMTAIEFVRDLLVNGLNAKKVIIGYDHRFGRNRNANINDLRNFGSTLDFEVEEIPAQEIEDVSVSSTKIRKALLEADIETANSFLGYHYMINGTVTKGKGIGKTLGYPTANIKVPEDYKLIPKNGVYAVKCKIKDRQLNGMMNIGFNPTVKGNTVSTEVNLFDFEGDIYDESISVEFIKHIREEEKFDSLDALKAQLFKDKQTVQDLFSK